MLIVCTNMALCLVMGFWSADDSQARAEGGPVGLLQRDGSAAPCCADDMPASVGCAVSLAG